MRRSALALLAASSALVVLVPAAAFACGGLFCAAVPADSPVPPEPVDQTAERIVFEVGTETVTAHVQISYTGPADEFAWIVPVSGTPDVFESQPEMFADVDAATALDVVLPPPDLCPSPSGGGGDGGRGCVGGCAQADSAAVADGAEARGADGQSPVTVYAQDVTDNYEYSVIGAAEASDLVGWLQINQFNVSENMVPVMQPYIDEGMRYLAVKLREGRAATDIQPLAIRYEGSQPMIPIRLTAVAAQPLMGIQVWIFADAPYVPENYTWMAAQDREIMSDENGNTSYFSWVARTVDEHMGLLFVAEFVGQNQTGRFPQHDVVSRYYTRLNPERMTVDPLFEEDPTAPVVDNILDLSWQVSPFGCGGVDFGVLPSPCAYHYCGDGAECAVVDGRVGCVCRDGEVAQAITGPSGARTLTCVPAENPFGITAAAGGAGTEFDPCAGVDCGAGACVLRNGFPTCACDDGSLACLEPDGSVACLPTPAGMETFGPGAGVESAASVAAKRSYDGGRDGSSLPLGPLVPGAMLSVWMVSMRGRRRQAKPLPLRDGALG